MCVETRRLLSTVTVSESAADSTSPQTKRGAEEEEEEEEEEESNATVWRIWACLTLYLRPPPPPARLLLQHKNSMDAATSGQTEASHTSPLQLRSVNMLYTHKQQTASSRKNTLQYVNLLQRKCKPKTKQS